MVGSMINDRVSRLESASGLSVGCVLAVSDRWRSATAGGEWLRTIYLYARSTLPKTIDQPAEADASTNTVESSPNRTQLLLRRRPLYASVEDPLKLLHHHFNGFNLNRVTQRASFGNQILLWAVLDSTWLNKVSLHCTDFPLPSASWCSDYS